MVSEAASDYRSQWRRSNPLQPRSAVHLECCVAGYASMSVILAIVRGRPLLKKSASKALEREVHELHRANMILRLASAFLS